MDDFGLIHERIVSDMDEGVLTIGLGGRITSLNRACTDILGVAPDIIGKAFAAIFFEYDENDDFNQAILDAVYENKTIRNVAVSYFNGVSTKKLFITTSYLKNEGQKVGVVAVINDVTELFELRDAMIAMEKIKKLNEELTIRNEFIFKTFGRYLSDDIVKNILESDGGLEIGGKKQEITIMFTDLRGFTAISERMEPTDLISMLNHYLAEMIDVVSENNGTILDFIGDALVIAFGAPVYFRENAETAVKTAILMQNKMAEVNAFNRENGFPEIEMGIGIHTGDVILGNIGSDKKTKYDIIGPNVNYASRIETYTVGGQILMSEQTKDKAPAVVLGTSKEILPKGVSTPRTIYEVLGCGDLSLVVKEETFETPAEDIILELFTIDGKSVSTEGITVKVLRYSAKKVFIDKTMEDSTNVKFYHKGEELYGKIADGNCVRITLGSF